MNQRLRIVLACVVSVLMIAVTPGLASASGRVARTGLSDQAGGGNLTVLTALSAEGGWNGLDPPTDTTSAANYDYLNAIYGELFEPGPNHTIVPDLATSYHLSNQDRKLVINLRHGVTFQDGTAFDAQAVAFNINRDLDPKLACHCAENFMAVQSTQAVGRYQVVMTLKQPDPSIVNAFIASAPNWIVSPTALGKTTEADFALHPVGAGPFEVVSAVPNHTIKLKRNPGYWHHGFPRLSTLTFETIGTDESAYEAILAGQAQVYLGLGTAALIAKAKKTMAVYRLPATAATSVSLGTRTAPFNNIKAREAIFYATNAAALNKINGDLGTLTESPTGPGGLYYEPKVPGYPQYDPAKAKALVKSLGGLSFTLATLNTTADVQMAEALKSEWAEVGIQATIGLYDIPTIVKLTEQHAIQAIYTSVGNYDPSLLPGVASFYSSTGPFSNVALPPLDTLIDRANQALNAKTAATRWHAVFHWMAVHAVAPFLFTQATYDIATRAVTGITTSSLEIPWEDVATS